MAFLKVASRFAESPHHRLSAGLRLVSEGSLDFLHGRVQLAAQCRVQLIDIGELMMQFIQRGLELLRIGWHYTLSLFTSLDAIHRDSIYHSMCADCHCLTAQCRLLSSNE